MPTQATAFTGASALHPQHLAVALAIVATAAVVSGALFLLRRARRPDAPRKLLQTPCADPMEEDPVDCGSPCASEATCTSTASDSKDGADGKRVPRAASPPNLAPSSLLAAGRPTKEADADAAPGLLVFTSSRTNTTPAPRKGAAAAAPKPCWRYSFGKAFIAAAADPPAAVAGRVAAEGKENAGGAVLLPSKHLASRLFERMSKRRKKDAAPGSSPPQPPPVLAGNKHNLPALPPMQQSPKKPKILPLDAPAFGSPVTSPLQPLLANIHHNPLHSVEAFPPRAHLRRLAAAPAALSSSAPTFSFMPASPPTAGFLAPPPPATSTAGALFSTSFPPTSGTFVIPPALSIPPTFSPPTLSLASSPSASAAAGPPAPPLAITLPSPVAPAPSPTAAAPSAPAAAFHFLGTHPTPAPPAAAPPPAAPRFATALAAAAPALATPSPPTPSAPPLPTSTAGSKRRTEGPASADTTAEDDSDDRCSEHPAKRKGRPT